LPAPPPLPPDTLRRGARRRQAKLAGGGAVAAAAVAGVALLVLPSTGPDRVVPAERPTAPATAPPSTSASDRPIVEASAQLGPEPERTTDPTAPTVVLQSDGLGLLGPTGSNRMQLFGEADPQVLRDALTRAIGPGTPSDQPDCGPAVTSVSYGGFQVLFDGGRFVGWYLADPGPDFDTVLGLGTGSTLAELRADLRPFEVTQTSIGREWSGGGLSGLLEGEGEGARAIAVWAGNVCLFR
jgi:hypothetical protein